MVFVNSFQNDVISLLMLWLKSLTIELDVISCNFGYIQLEMYLSGFSANLLNNQIVKKYKLNYFKYDGSDEIDIESYITQNKINVQTSFTDNIYETNCISFVKLNEHQYVAESYFFKIIAMDCNNKSIVASSWQKIHFRNDHRLHLVYKSSNVQRFFETKIDVNQRKMEGIGLSDWVLALSNIEIFQYNFDEFDCKRVFHFIQHAQCVKDFTFHAFMDKKKTIDFMDFYVFVTDDTIGEGLSDTIYKTYIQNFRACVHLKLEIDM